MNKVAVVGAGPKGIALAIKASVLREMGLNAPEVGLIEKTAVANNWTRSGGWTDGGFRLGVHPLKDIGYPYPPSGNTPVQRQINERMLDYSWLSYLTDSGQLGSWINHGAQNPKHQQFADYLRWALAKSGCKVQMGDVNRMHLSPSTRSWILTVEGAEGSSCVKCDGVVVTGAGSHPRRFSPVSKRVIDLDRFWYLNMSMFAEKSVAVIGAGESAGCVLSRLSAVWLRRLQVIAPAPWLRSRNEEYFENQFFDDPDGWQELTEEERIAFVRQTDRGVISAGTLAGITNIADVEHSRGRVVAVHETSGGRLEVAIQANNGEIRHTDVDYVVDASGPNRLWFRDIVDEATMSQIPSDALSIARRLSPDLSLDGLGAKLFLPMFSALRYGPGFPNLSALGRLSNVILGFDGDHQSARRNGLQEAAV